MKQANDDTWVTTLPEQKGNEGNKIYLIDHSNKRKLTTSVTNGARFAFKSI